MPEKTGQVWPQHRVTHTSDRVELTLPGTGVCGGAGLFGEPAAGQADDGGCCAAPAPALMQIAGPTATEERG